jgi:Leucine-rich repeat (LRR) protein
MMRKGHIGILRATFLTMLLVAAFSSCVFAEGDKLDLSKTPELEEQIRLALYKPEGDIYREELQRITQLKLGDKDLFILKDTPQLKELELVIPMYAWIPETYEELLAPLQQLEVLKLTQDYPVTFYTRSFPIEALKAPEKLKTLYINDHNMNNLSWLPAFSNLESLTVVNTKISDITCLEKLEALKHLDLRDNRIRMIPDLTGLKNLQSLHLEGNPIVDYSKLGLISKQLKEKDFLLGRNTSGNATFTILEKETVTFVNRELEQQVRKQLGKTEGPLTCKELLAVKSLSYAAGNHYSEGSEVPLEDLKYFGGLESLNLTLSKYGNLDDTDAISKLKKLRSLSLTGYCMAGDIGTIFDLNWLTELQGLRQLSVQDFIIYNWASLGKLRSLELLKLTGVYSPESLDLRILKPLKSLKHLSLSSMILKEVEALQSLTKLTRLELEDSSLSASLDKATGKYGFFNQNGERGIKTLFQQARDFHNGIAAVQDKDKWRFINIKGQYITKIAYKEVRDFSEGYAAVSDGKCWGFINAKGILEVPLQYEKVGDFHEGLAFASKKEHNATYGFDFNTWGFIDSYNRFAIKIGTDDPYGAGGLVSSFQDGVAKYIHYKHYTTTMVIIDTKGKILEQKLLEAASGWME